MNTLVKLLIITISIGQFSLASGQCVLQLNAIQQSESTCQANGIIKATLSGSDLHLIDLPNVKYSVTSTRVGGFSTPLSANDGLIVAVPPGSYTVTAEYFCPTTSSFQTVVGSNLVQMIGTYPGFDQDKIYILTAQIQASLKCQPIGSAPLYIEGGKTPYSASIVAASDPTYIGKTYTSATAGVLLIDQLPPGNYSIKFTDGCYSVPRSFIIPEQESIFELTQSTPTPSCSQIGSLSFNVQHASPPYTLQLNSANGSASFNVAQFPFTIAQLSAGTYTVTLNDKCSQKTITAEVALAPPNAQITFSTDALTCSSVGSITFDLSGGEPPYILKMTQPNVIIYPNLPNGKFTINNLPSGNYQFSLTDKCGLHSINYNTHLKSSSIQAILKSKPIVAIDCDATSNALLEVTQGAEPYQGVFLTKPPSYIAPPLINLSNGDINLTNLPVGSYSVEFTDKCGAKDTVDFQIETLPVKSLIHIRKSLDCQPTGRVEIILSQGKAPYSVFISQHPPQYTGPVNGFLPIPPGNIFILDNLPEGRYEFEIMDACGSHKEIVIIGVVPSSWFLDPFYPFFYPPQPNDPNCKLVDIKRNLKEPDIHNDPDLFYYWISHVNDYFEMAIREDNSVTPLVWGPVSNIKTVSFVEPSVGYCQGRQDNRFFNGYIRFKNAPQCIELPDVIRFSPLETTVVGPNNPTCSGSSFSFTHSENSIFCYPYTWDLINASGQTLQQGTVSTIGTQVINMVPDGTYTIRFTDAEGCTWTSLPFVSQWTNPSTPNLVYSNLSCNQYDFEFVDPQICLPYQWELKLGNTVVIPLTNVTDYLVQKIPALQYHTNYVLNIYTGQNNLKTYQINQASPLKANYTAQANYSFCLPDTAHGQIVITRNGALNLFEKGSVLRFISGPSIPTVQNILIATNGLTSIYPFSTNFINAEFVDIKPGIYEFELEDTCQTKHTLSVTYEQVKLSGFEVNTQRDCNGVLAFPKGQLYIGSTAVDTYFQVYSAPPGVTVPAGSVSSGGSFLLTHSGSYIFQVSHYNNGTACPYDTLKFNHNQLTFSLDIDSTTAYLCNNNAPGFVSARQKNGIGPFNYSLYHSSGLLIEQNSTGDFYIPNAVGNAAYRLEVEDIYCSITFNEPIQMINLSTANLVPADFAICAHTELELSASSLGRNTTYNWTGPNGFNTTVQNPKIPNVESNQAGIYQVGIKPLACIDTIKQQVEVGIIDPPKPLAPDTVLCHNSNQIQLQLNPETGYSVLWYDDQGVLLFPQQAPSPSTSTVTDYHYFVSHRHNSLGCIGNQQQVTVKISDLPQPVSNSFAPDICPGISAKVMVYNSLLQHNYYLYNHATAGTALTTQAGTGDSIILKASDLLYQDKDYYVEVSNQYACPSASRAKVSVKIVDYLTLGPNKLPAYERGVSYNQQLITNALAPYVFNTSDLLPAGLSLDQLGNISGTPPRNGKIDPATFKVIVEDKDGCIKDRTYLLESALFIPQILTPNGDGKNDHFMAGHRLIIFDRLGIIVFEGQDGWDGSINGAKAPADTYFYLLYFSDENTGLETRKNGFVTLLR